MPKASHLAVLGVGKETVPGTGVQPTMSVPFKTLTPKDDLALIEDDNKRGSAVDIYGLLPGQKGSELDLGGAVYADTIGWMLASVLPDVVVTGSASPYSTVFAALNTGDTQPKSQTWTIYDPLGTWLYAGQQCSELGLKWNADGLLEWSAKYNGWAYSTGTTPTPSFSAVAPVANWATQTQLGGVAAFVQDGELTIKRAVTVIKGAAGTQNPYRVWSGDVAVDGKLTLVMENTTQRTAFQAGTPTSVDFAYTQGAAATTNGLDLHCSTVKFTEGTPNYGKDYIELPVAFRAIANTTDIGASLGYSPIKATLTNAIASGTYA